MTKTFIAMEQSKTFHPFLFALFANKLPLRELAGIPFHDIANMVFEITKS